MKKEILLLGQFTEKAYKVVDGLINQESSRFNSSPYKFNVLAYDSTKKYPKYPIMLVLFEPYENFQIFKNKKEFIKHNEKVHKEVRRLKKEEYQVYTYTLGNENDLRQLIKMLFGIETMMVHNDFRFWRRMECQIKK